MKYILFLLMALPIIGMGQTVRAYTEHNGHYFVELVWRGNNIDTIGHFEAVPVTIDFQYTRRDVPMTIDCYLINGIPYRKSCAPLTKGKWVRVQCYRWRISNGWVNAQNK